MSPGLPLLAVLPPLAAQVAALEPTAAMRSVWDGDRAWLSGDRKTAFHAYRRAVHLGDDPASEAMARLRLLSFEGNLGLAFEGPRIDAALAACTRGAWCQLAWADYDLFAPAAVGARRQDAVAEAERAAGDLPGPALARRILATGDRGLVHDLGALSRDGLGDGLVTSGGTPPASPGTWFLGAGLIGAPGLGIGGSIHFVHPDVGWRELLFQADAGATSTGCAWTWVNVATPGTWHAVVDAGAAQTVTWVWGSDAESRAPASETDAEALSYTTLQASAGPGVRLRHHVLRVGGTTRWDLWDDEWLAGPAAWVFWRWDRRHGPGPARRGTLLQTRAESALPFLGADYAFVDLAGEVAGYSAAPFAGAFAARLLGEAAPFHDTPFFLLPSAGGADVLRGAPTGRYRGNVMVAADLEYRHAIAGPLSATIFGDGAWLSKQGPPHPGAGLGLRLALPPQDQNVLRLDAAVSDAGWGLSTGWGEVF
jgi:hypothetical protein